MNLPHQHPDRRGVWLDVAAFALGLGVAWWQQWSTTDLVWSLWLSSLVVGWCVMVWGIFGPAVFIVRRAWYDRHRFGGVRVAASARGINTLLVGGLFLLAFFTLHYGGFHYVHSVFLQVFFPVPGGPELRSGAPGAGTYLQVVRDYWMFLPAAFLAERQAFRFAPADSEARNVSVKAPDITARKKRNAAGAGMADLMGPYKNVVRMHLLIFFFAAAHFAHLDSFLVYAVVYAVYFFPWRLVRREKPVPATAG